MKKIISLLIIASFLSLGASAQSKVSKTKKSGTHKVDTKKGGTKKGGTKKGGASGTVAKPIGSKAWNTENALRWFPSTLLKSDNGQFSLVFQEDGNLVVYKNGNNAIWASGTNGKGGKSVEFQKNGNLVIYRGDFNSGHVIWQSNSPGRGGETLVLENDGELLIHASGAIKVWSVSTNPIQYGRVMQITNYFPSNELNIENGALEASKMGAGAWSAMWILEPVAGTNYVKIKNRWKGTYLNIEGGQGVKCTDIQTGWQSAQWELIPYSEGVYNIKNRWKDVYLNLGPNGVECNKIHGAWELDYDFKD